MEFPLRNMAGETAGTLTLNPALFDVPMNQALVHQVAVAHMANARQGTASTKTRGMVSGGGAKPWKQKGTGRARVGSTRNPSRVHGGSAFGPKPHKYNVKINKKVKVLAKKSALSLKISSDEYKILDEFKLESNKTKDFIKILKIFELNDSKVTLLTSEKNKNLYYSSRNLEKVNLVHVESFSTYDIINSNFVLFDMSSVEYLNNHLSN